MNTPDDKYVAVGTVWCCTRFSIFNFIWNRDLKFQVIRSNRCAIVDMADNVLQEFTLPRFLWKAPYVLIQDIIVYSVPNYAHKTVYLLINGSQDLFSYCYCFCLLKICVYRGIQILGHQIRLSFRVPFWRSLSLHHTRHRKLFQMIALFSCNMSKFSSTVVFALGK